MAATTRVFAARVAGLAVFGPDGESIGKVRDVVAGLRAAGQPPRILGLVMEMAARRRIFVPMLRVVRVEPNAVTLATGSVNTRQFHQRPNEVLVLGQLLDAKVTLAATGASAVLVDAALEQTRTRDWRISRLAVRERTGRLGRRGPVQVVEWDQITGLAAAELTDRPQGVAQLLALLDTMRAVDVASTLHELPAKRRYEVAEALDDERLADVVEELPEDDQKDLIGHLGEDRAADVLEAMSPDDAADLLAELPEVDKNRLLELMEPAESAPVKRLLAYSADTAGGLMTPEPVVLGPDATIAEALAMVRNAELPVALASMVFVCRPPSATPTGRYLGCVHIQRLLREPPSTLVAGALDTTLASLPPTATLAEVTRYFAAYNLVCGPVLDDQEHLIGAVTVDDVLDHLLPENWRESGLPDDRNSPDAPKASDDA
ncbi:MULTISPECIES: magnesium transporter MgtE N-terminal domain-containing protein [Saccharopolyspora]|uniref:CBS domain-containing protein n=1 Tax=Saccharopolyspora gregorii TaxID=33914 RepID=A0ABP6S208_9PSEU|nr:MULTISPECIES: CBS domain-containing protein [Saccharopolyspora]MCA1185471.1 CBS domain-containing protein [Saccharopolyspora sp. 6T]MCA1192306.1 CBS domain-containing protein [Saccharopolyspora sp. 6V]MCA1225188.1 CBS domain-containing protein [Saccharopolyspora sp. 6M]MCA1279573.1 CBS domain-containing protein [Saccharopolyspora sp. 7B]